MPAKAFFDTNVLIYALAEADPRSQRAEALLADGGTVSVQILNEFVSVTRRKMRLSWKEVTDALDAIRVLCGSPLSITTELHEAALRIAQRHRYEIYDALVAAAALQAGCTVLYSEDLQDGQVLNRQLHIRNPFK